MAFAEFHRAVVTQSDRLRGKAVFSECMEQIASAMDQKGMSTVDLMRALDSDGNGEVDRNELGLGLEVLLGHNLSAEHIDILFEELDLDGDGTIDSVEFTSKISLIRGEPDLQTAIEKIVAWMDTNSHTVQTMMALFDQDADGRLTPEEMHDGFAEHIPELDDDHSKYLCKHFDQDGGNHQIIITCACKHMRARADA